MCACVYIYIEAVQDQYKNLESTSTSFRTLMAHSTRDIHNVGQPTLHMHYGQGMG